MADPTQLAPTPLHFCVQCGQQMARKRFPSGKMESRKLFLRRKFCDQKCMALAMEKKTCASISHSRMNSSRTAKAVCETCGVGGDLHVHHKDENPRNNVFSNLMTLCRSCHSRAHSPNFTETGEQRVHCEHCLKPSIKKGLCATHLSRLRRHGHPLAKKQKIGLEWILSVPSG